MKLGVKLQMILASALFVCATMALPAFAQSAAQDFEQYENSHPELKANPSLMNNPTYLANHPDLARWLERHPQFDRRRYGGMGAYDSGHQWRDANWWHQNDPNWINQHHPEWYNDNPSWKRAAVVGDGDYDEHHEWHARDWWTEHHPNWVKKHHPNWYAHAQADQAHEEAVNHGHVHPYGHDHDHN